MRPGGLSATSGGESILRVFYAAMTDELLNHAPTLRLGVFLGLFMLMAGWECLAARRERKLTRLDRWPGNLGVSFLDAFLARLVAPAGAVGFALFAEARGFGLFHTVTWPVLLEVLVSVVVLDFAIYWQHRLFHFVPVLWRLHRMHRADLGVDVTTGARKIGASSSDVFNPVKRRRSLVTHSVIWHKRRPISIRITRATGTPPSPRSQSWRTTGPSC